MEWQPLEDASVCVTLWPLAGISSSKFSAFIVFVSERIGKTSFFFSRQLADRFPLSRKYLQVPSWYHIIETPFPFALLCSLNEQGKSFFKLLFIYYLRQKCFFLNKMGSNTEKLIAWLYFRHFRRPQMYYLFSIYFKRCNQLRRERKYFARFIWYICTFNGSVWTVCCCVMISGQWSAPAKGFCPLKAVTLPRRVAGDLETTHMVGVGCALCEPDCWLLCSDLRPPNSHSLHTQQA